MRTVAEFRKELQTHVDAIWADEPKDIFLIRHGYLGSDAGIGNQYFSPLVMLSGEMRSLGIMAFPRMLEFARSGEFSLSQIVTVAEALTRVDRGVIGYFGLREYGALLVEFNDIIRLVQSMEEMIGLLEDMFTLTNRYQLWLYQIFPWHLSVHFPKPDTGELKTLLELVQEN